jgi:hypothetical protein
MSKYKIIIISIDQLLSSRYLKKSSTAFLNDMKSN